MKTMSGPKGRRAILFQNAVQNARRRQHSEPRAARGAEDGTAARDVKELQAHLEAAFDGKDAA